MFCCTAEGFPESVFSKLSCKHTKKQNCTEETKLNTLTFCRLLILSVHQCVFLCSPSLRFPLQIATSSWPMLRCPRVSPSSTAPMASVSWRASLGLRWCRRAVPASSCMGRRQAKASSSALATPWRSARSSRMRSCFIKRQVSVRWIFLKNIYPSYKQLVRLRSNFWAGYVTSGPDGPRWSAGCKDGCTSFIYWAILIKWWLKKDIHCKSPPIII